MTLAPPSLPPYIFLMSDHTTAKLAHEVAEALSTRYPSMFVDDFLAPIHEGLAAMFELDWKRDMGDPRATQGLFSPKLSGESTERDIIVSLEKWFIEQFGEGALGQLARMRCDERNATADYITVFRDTNRANLKGFGELKVAYEFVNLQLHDDVEAVLKRLGA